MTLQTATLMGDVHILLTAPTPTPAGGHKVVYEYANALAAEGVRVTIWHSNIFFSETAGRKRLLRVAKSHARRLLRPTGRASVTWFPLDERVTVRTTGGFPNPSLRPQDVVIATAIETTPHAARLASVARARSAALIQGYETWGGATADFISAAWRAVDTRIAIAPWLVEKCTAAGLSATLLPNVINAASFPPGPPLAQRKLQVMSLLSSIPVKRADVAMGALAAIARRRPGVSVIGFGQDARPRVAADCIQYFQNPEPSLLSNLYQTSMVYLCGSDSEGWHLPPAEATLSGAAVVSTDIQGVRVSMEQDALYAPPGDIDGLAAAALAIMDDLPAAQSRISNAQSRLLARTYSSNARELMHAVGLVD